MKVSLLLTGNELMSGDTIDSNSAYVAQSLKDIGVVPYVKKVVGDDLELLVSSIQELANLSDVLIVNGGLGPTVDDLTAQALAEATTKPIVRHPKAYQHLVEWAAPRDFKLTESNLKQADLPEGCELIENPNGSAVGFYCLYLDCLILCTPGVPSEFKPMVENQLLALICEHGAIEAKSTISRLRLFGITESGLQDMVNDAFPDWPSDVELGFRVQLPVIEVKIATVGDEFIELNSQWTEKFNSLFADYIIGQNSTRLTQALNQALVNTDTTIVTAESCTGGAIVSGIISEAGSSAIIGAGYVVYSNAMKTSMLGVSEQTLMEFGAVSENTVREMAAGALEKSGADMALVTSGIAGPTGGTTDKPIGLVWIAWGRKNKIHARSFFLPIGRLAFQRTASAIAMDLARREVLGLNTAVDYYSELKNKH